MSIQLPLESVGKYLSLETLNINDKITFPDGSNLISGARFGTLNGFNQQIASTTNCTFNSAIFIKPVVDLVSGLTTYEGTVRVTPLNPMDQCSLIINLHSLDSVVIKPYFWATAEGYYVGDTDKIQSIGVSPPNTSTPVSSLRITVTFQPSNTNVHRIRFTGIF